MENMSDNIQLIDTPLTKNGQDAFSLTPYIESLASIVRTCETPMTISIQGDWGSGKTSFVHLVQKEVENPTNEIYFLEFNTWKYSKFEMDNYLIITLIKKFTDKIIDITKKDNPKGAETLGKIVKLLEDLTKPLGKILAKKIGHHVETFSDIDFESLITAFSSALKKEDYTSEDSVIEIIEHLQETIAKQMKSFEGRLVVFIDDLDRLSPAKAVDILEVLQLFLSTTNCVFLLAVDYEVITLGFKEKMGQNYSVLKSKNFFDKIIQLPFTIPVNQYSNENAQDYITQLLQNLSNKIPEPILNKLDKGQLVEIIRTSIQFNPRRLKRVMNAYWFTISVMKSRGSQQEGLHLDENYYLALFYILCLQTNYEQIYLFFTENGDNPEELQQFIDYSLKDPKENLKNPIREYDKVLNDLDQFIENNDPNFQQIEFKNVKRFLELMKDLFPPEKFNATQSYNWDLLRNVLNISASTSNRNSDVKKQTVGKYILAKIINMSLTENDISNLTKDSYSKNNLRTIYPVFKDITTTIVEENNDKQSFNTIQELQYFIREKKLTKKLREIREIESGENTSYSRYYKDPIIMPIEGEVSRPNESIQVENQHYKVLFLTNDWKDYQREAFDNWYENKKVINEK